MAFAPEQQAIGLRRHFTIPGIDAEDSVVWERRDARITDWRDGSMAFEQLDTEFPKTWSTNASNIVAQKYFRGTLGTSERESSLRHVIRRVVGTIADWGTDDGYFSSEDECSTFRAELTWLLVNQRLSFNSPVWFNIGVPGVPQQASACFILSVDDTMDDILNWYTEEGRIFKGGSGSGANLSRIRSSKETLRGGGEASGPVSFMRGADASAGTIKSGGKTRRAAKMVILDVDHPDIGEFIWCKAREEDKARVLRDAGFDMDLDGADAYSIQYQNANNSVRLSDEFMEAVISDLDWDLTARVNGEVIETVRARHLWHQLAEAAWQCADPGIQFDTTINRWHTTPQSGRINASNPCSEYLHLDNSACNLASLNLLTFLDPDDSFDVDGFKQAIGVAITAQDILVGRADYPTEAIAETSLQFRQLGLGYTNLGATLMALGSPYDSESGRGVAAGITALMGGHAYAMSAVLAARLGAFGGFSENRDDTLRVLRQHVDAAAALDGAQVPAALLDAARASWNDALAGARSAGIRNAQTTVLAPTGTISFMMDCDTTGVEPDLGLVKFKKLVGGGTMSVVNQTVPRALRKLGYPPEHVETICAHITENASIVGAPHLRDEHLGVFACSVGANAIHYEGHVRMMGAVQPFLSGAISKTVNLPEEATIDDIADLHMLSWQLGLKAVAVYRDNCKVAQPVSTSIADSSLGETDAAVAEAGVTAVVRAPEREPLPRHRSSKTISFRVADCHGFMTVGQYEDGRPGEIFLTVAKQGSTLAGIMDAFAISVSHGLQYGVPLRAYVEAYTNVRFEPAGITDDPDLRIVTSLVDYIFRRLALEYLTLDERQDLGVLTSDERLEPTLPGMETAALPIAQISQDIPVQTSPAGSQVANLGFAGRSNAASSAPICFSCGDVMMRAGSCYACRNCGSTSGCS